MTELTEVMKIREAVREDVPALLDIYNYEVINGVTTLDLNPRTPDEWYDWFENHNIGNHPLIVGVIGGKIAGYASLSDYRSKEAYKSTVELSIYVSPDFRRMGVGGGLMGHIIGMAKNDPDTHCVVSVITSGNVASAKLHKKFGFTYCGMIPSVGIKFGRYLDIENYALIV
ncbi:MAG: GNAT family N-acetyltransferase [Eubacteriales bacterium]